MFPLALPFDIITHPYLPFSEFTDKIQLFHDYLKWKEFFIFKCLLLWKGKKGREFAAKIRKDFLDQ